eukprot:364639-Chlamydomonas_euryale.AAC.54
MAMPRRSSGLLLKSGLTSQRCAVLGRREETLGHSCWVALSAWALARRVKGRCIGRRSGTWMWKTRMPGYIVIQPGQGYLQVLRDLGLAPLCSVTLRWGLRECPRLAHHKIKYCSATLLSAKGALPSAPPDF